MMSPQTDKSLIDVAQNRPFPYYLHTVNTRNRTLIRCTLGASRSACNNFAYRYSTTVNTKTTLYTRTVYTIVYTLNKLYKVYTIVYTVTTVNSINTVYTIVYTVSIYDNIYSKYSKYNKYSIYNNIYSKCCKYNIYNILNKYIQ